MLGCVEYLEANDLDQKNGETIHGQRKGIPKRIVSKNIDLIDVFPGMYPKVS